MAQKYLLQFLCCFCFCFVFLVLMFFPTSCREAVARPPLDLLVSLLLLDCVQEKLRRLQRFLRFQRARSRAPVSGNPWYLRLVRCPMPGDAADVDAVEMLLKVAH